jgi:hypothetical protein
MKIAGLSVLRLNSKGELEQPVTNLYGQKFSLAPLDDDEQSIFEDNFNKLLSTTDSQVRKILEERVETIVAGIMAIKEKLNRRKFRGMNPGDGEIGFGFIRPGYTRHGGNTTGSERTSWSVTFAAIGTWVAYLDGANATTFFSMSEDHGLIITHLVSQVSPNPFVREIHFQIGRVNLIPEDVSDILIGDNNNQVAVFPIPTKIVLPEDQLLVTANGEAGTEHLKLGGLVVGLGRLLKLETPTWVP